MSPSNFLSTRTRVFSDSSPRRLEVQPSKVVAVLGFASHRMQRELQDLPIRIVLNHEWREGIGSSIKAGINAVGFLCPEPAFVKDTSAGEQDISSVAMTDGNKKLPEGSFFLCRAVSSTCRYTRRRRVQSCHDGTQAESCSQAQGVRRETESEGRKAKLQAEA